MNYCATNTHTTIVQRLRVRGLVQGVGFRPTVWRVANELQLSGDVCNDGSGVLINLIGSADQLARFSSELQAQCPPLARIDSIEEIDADPNLAYVGFHIVESQQTDVHTGVVADAATCPECLQDTLDRGNRRYLYPFTNCTHCGPRFSIVRAIPYDRANTSMQEFELCEDCAAEYGEPSDRRFHAQPNACPLCGPHVWLSDAQGAMIGCADPVAEAAARLEAGQIVAIKGIGGMHLACDARNAEALNKLRERKHRPHKPLALMASDVAEVRNYCQVSDAEAEALNSPAAPIVVLPMRAPGLLPDAVAPGQKQLGFMLPYSPLHHLLMRRLGGPIVLTSGNLSEEPQCTENEDALKRLNQIADCQLLHNRPIVNRIDDSVVRFDLGEQRMLRRARGYAPAQLALPPGFEQADGLLALGGELKNTFCLIKDGQAILSQHMGDLEDARTFEDYQHNLELYKSLYAFEPETLVIDEHPEYVSAKLGRDWATQQDLLLEPTQHHHAHIASCLGDNGVDIDHAKVIGIALDGLGMGDDGSLWGGEILHADYRGYIRLARLKPVALPGGAQAMREPWRNTYAHLQAAGLWDELAGSQAPLALVQQLQDQPLQTLDIMLERGLNCPPCSSAGRLFDAVAAALELTPARCSYEGQAAMSLEALVDAAQLAEASAYPFALSEQDDLLQLEPTPMWQALLADLADGTDKALIAARFHKGLAQALVDLAAQLAQQYASDTVALSGGVLQNRTLLGLLHDGLSERGLNVLSHRSVPANDGGLSLGQALIAAARQQHRR